jgi:Putative zinc-finger
MDCNLARQLIPFSHAGGADLDPAERAELSRHLAGCPACAALGASNCAFDSQLGLAMRTVPIPDGFSARLQTRLIAARLAYFRRAAIKLLIVMLALGLAYSAWSAWRRPTFEPGQLAQQTYEFNGSSRGPQEAQGLATEWLRRFDKHLEAPDDFNYNLLSFAETANFEGLTAVPTLVFARQNATMRVHVVRESALRNLGDVHEEMGGCTVETRRYESMPGWVFVIVTSGAAPDAFRPPARTADPA